MSNQEIMVDSRPHTGILSIFQKDNKDKHDPSRLALLRFYANKPAVFGLILFILL